LRRYAVAELALVSQVYRVSLAAPRVAPREVAAGCRLHAAAAARDAAALAPAPAAALPALRREYADAALAALRAYRGVLSSTLKAGGAGAAPPAVDGAEARALADPASVTDCLGWAVQVKPI